MTQGEVALAWFSRGEMKGKYMTREDRAEEAREYRRAITIEGWEYFSQSIKVLKEDNALTEIDSFVNSIAKEGWRLHTIQFGIVQPVVYLVFERQKDYR